MKQFSKWLLILAFALPIVGCSKDDDEKKGPSSTLEDKYFTIENATYVNGEMPASTTSEALEGVDMSDQVMNGAMNYVTVETSQEVSSFYLGIKDVPGYFEYVPSVSRSSSSTYNVYIIPVMISESYVGNCTIVICAKLTDGKITGKSETKLSYLETKKGALEVKLAFSNSKDVDLHLYTPSGEHIYYGNRGGYYYDDEDEDAPVIEYGLDIDSNAGCDLDHVNKENIYIPAELMENGVYTVVVDMYSNCDPSIATDWSIVTRYNGQLIQPISGKNPASGRYEVGARDDDMTEVMKFEIKGAGTRAVDFLKSNPSLHFRPKALRPSDEAKLDLLMFK